jgi:hypothetical protein
MESPHLLGDAERRWEKNMALLQEVLCLWVERSKCCPLFISIGFSTINQAARNGWGGEDPLAKVLPLYMRLIHLVCSASGRWKSVELDILTSPNYNVTVGDLLALRPDDVAQALENIPRLLSLHLDCSVPSQRLRDAAAVRTRFQAMSTTLLQLLTPTGDGEGNVTIWPLCPKLERFACTLLMMGFT